MVNLDNLLFGGSITIFMNDEKEIVGNALYRMRSDGVVPIDISSEKLEFINNYKGIISSLRNGNKLYCANGRMYIGYNEYRGPYAEEDIFISFSDVGSMSFVEMVNQIENKLSRNDVRRLKLTRIGDFYTQMSNKK